MSDAMRRLVALLHQLPGIGEKTATRLVLAILSAGGEFGRSLSEAVAEVVARVRPCPTCGNLSERAPCEVCSDPKRDQSVLCVVERIGDLMAIEASRQYRGLYHVLHGVLDPLQGAGPDQIRVAELLRRFPGEFKEVILATSSGVEGEATALYLRKRLAPLGVKISRIASGIPVGGELEYVDGGTIGRALTGRRDMD
jgi:recombination protein RecR